MTAGVVVLGAGQAGFQLAHTLREGGGFSAPVTLIGAEAELPYQRPSLSKAFLKGEDTADALAFRPAAFFAKHAITLRLGVPATAIGRERRQVRIGAGEWLAYDHLVLATGTRNRRLALPGAGLAGVLSLRSAADGLALRAALRRARRVVVLGGGFLGLEVAASARAMGADVHALEAGARLMGRAASPVVSQYFLSLHRANGITVALGETAAAIVGETQAEGIVTPGGDHVAADLVVAAIGVVPNTEIAAEAGLAVDGDIVVNDLLRTSDPLVHAIGDCVLFPAPSGGVMRLESVQNAVDQARCAAAALLGQPQPYGAVPWFWSDQGRRLQIAGLTAHADDTRVEGHGDAFTVY